PERTSTRAVVRGARRDFASVAAVRASARCRRAAAPASPLPLGAASRPAGQGQGEGVGPGGTPRRRRRLSAPTPPRRPTRPFLPEGDPPRPLRSSPRPPPVPCRLLPEVLAPPD